MSNSQQDTTDRERALSDDLPKNSWAKETAAALEILDVSQETGLDSEDVKKRRDKYGPNRLRQVERRSTWDILLEQFKSLIIIILIAAAIVSFARQQWIDGGAIVAVIILNSAIGFFTELRATRSIEALQELEKVEAVVRRDGEEKKIPAEEMVPGDIVVLESGEIVSADLRLLEAVKLQADESALTGESVPVDKQVEPVEEDMPLAERSNMIFKGTVIARGQGKGVVVASGMQTELGEISSLVEESAQDEETPLEKRLDRLGQKLVWLTFAVAGAVGVAGLLAGREIQLMIETAIALAIAAVPEGLPIVATVALARGMWRMLARNALIRRLSSVETLGATNIICTDKTGTITENRMTVEKLGLVSGMVEVQIEADREKLFKLDDHSVSPEENEPLRKAIQVAVLCNDAERKKETDENGQSEVETTGDPMEVALLSLGDRAGMSRSELVEQMPEVNRDPFDRETKMMVTVHESNDGGYFVAVKGAPKEVLQACGSVSTQDGEAALEEAEREEWMERNQKMAGNGLRLLALAAKTKDSPDGELYEDLTFLGLVGLLDPPREAVKTAIGRCQEAGIRVVMVTGDQPETARYIAREVGLVGGDDDRVIEGSNFGDPDNLSSDQREGILTSSIFARVTPEQKLNLIDLHQKNGSIVAMTGDGINDAPALKNADIGIAMGQRGTQVAREAADMILQDDAFPTIVAAVEQGRIIFENIRKFVIYLLSGNVGEILAVAAATVVAAPLPLLPLQILYLNMINDVFPALALGIGGSHHTVMNRSPRNPEEPIITRYHWGEIVGYGILIGATILGAFYLAFTWLGLDRTGAVTVSFLTLSITRLLHVFNVRHPDTGIFDNEITRNLYVWGALILSFGLLLLAVYWTPLAEILKVSGPNLKQWGLIFGASLAPLLVGQIYLAVFKAKGRQG